MIIEFIQGDAVDCVLLLKELQTIESPHKILIRASDSNEDFRIYVRKWFVGKTYDDSEVYDDVYYWVIHVNGE